MADTKISALPASTVPLAGTEVLPIVQSSTTKQVSVANLTAGRTFEALGVTLTSTDAGATAAPLIDLYRDSATPAASDTLGEIEFNGEDSAGNKQTYGVIHGSILSPTSTAEQGQLHFETATAGALTEKMIIGTTNLVINEIGAIFNVRIEGDTDANLFFTDATNSRVGIGTLSPASKLDVVGGDARIDNGNLIIGTSGKGIDFSITSHPAGMTSELLADYEEGTFTPTYTSTGIAPTVTYSHQYGKYTRIGRQVFFTVEIGTDSAVAGSGILAVGGLPFAAINDRYTGTCSVGYSSNFTTAAPAGGYVFANETIARLTYEASATSQTEMFTFFLTAGAGQNYLVISGSYIV